jgi:heptosyltransferase-3
VLTTPALALLKQARPDLRIALVVEDRFAPVFEGNPAVDKILSPKVSALARWRPHLVINFHGGTRSMVLTAASGARIRAGFEHFRSSAIYNVRIPTAQQILGVNRKVHTAEHLASAVFYLGVPSGNIPRAQVYAEARQAVPPYAIFHAVAATPAKTWPIANFLAVARHLQQQHSLRPVFIGGPGDDLSAFSEFQTLAGASLRESINLIAGATLFVGNDSGPAHLAAAMGRPVAVLFGPSDPDVWAPWRATSKVFVNTEDIAAIPAADVIQAIPQLRVSHK